MYINVLPTRASRLAWGFFCTRSIQLNVRGLNRNAPFSFSDIHKTLQCWLGTRPVGSRESDWFLCRRTVSKAANCTIEYFIKPLYGQQVIQDNVLLAYKNTSSRKKVESCLKFQSYIFFIQSAVFKEILGQLSI